jgi:hypothetical protein
MSIFAALKHIIPQFHAYADDDNRYNVGATWTGTDSLQDYHNVEFRYVHNSERLALQGDPQPDGSWRYVSPEGHIHTMSAERAQHFMEQTQTHASIMISMLQKLQDAGALDNIVDTNAQPA